MKAKRARGTGSVYKPERSQFFWIAFYQNGRLIRESTKTDVKTKAQSILTKRLQEVNSGNFSPDADKITVAEIYQHVLSDYEKRNRPSLATLKGRWHTDHSGHNRKGTRTTLKEFFGHLRCNQVTYSLLERFQLQRLSEGAAAGSINRELNILKVAWKYAMKAGELKTKPVFPTGLKENVRQGFITDDNYVAFVDACTETGGLWLRTAFEIAFTLGWRKREIINLRVRNVDLSDRTLRLNPDDTKTDKGRTAPMTEVIFQLVSQCCEGKGQDDFVLTRSNGEPIRCFRDSWLTVCRKVGKDGTLFHDMRRSAVSNLVKKGVARKVAMSISGHQTESIFNRYAIVETTDQAEALKIVEQKRAQNLQQPVHSHIIHTATAVPAQPSDESTTSKSIQ
ncbi:MAG: tyrosine-type recombinase/integrase [Terriglobales bacterium]